MSFCQPRTPATSAHTPVHRAGNQVWTWPPPSAHSITPALFRDLHQSRRNTTAASCQHWTTQTSCCKCGNRCNTLWIHLYKLRDCGLTTHTRQEPSDINLFSVLFDCVEDDAVAAPQYHKCFLNSHSCMKVVTFFKLYYIVIFIDLQTSLSESLCFHIPNWKKLSILLILFDHLSGKTNKIHLNFDKWWWTEQQVQHDEWTAALTVKEWQVSSTLIGPFKVAIQAISQNKHKTFSVIQEKQEWNSDASDGLKIPPSKTVIRQLSPWEPKNGSGVYRK